MSQIQTINGTQPMQTSANLDRDRMTDTHIRGCGRYVQLFNGVPKAVEDPSILLKPHLEDLEVLREDTAHTSTIYRPHSRGSPQVDSIPATSDPITSPGMKNILCSLGQ